LDCTPYVAEFFDAPALALVPRSSCGWPGPAAPEVIAVLLGATAAVHFQTKLTEPILTACPPLKSIVFLGTGVSSWSDLRAGRARGIRVRRVRGYADRTVAEH
jgi:D-3-phosphoglycerate dehydrogenase